MSFPKVLLLILLTLASSKNVVIIGDSRVCGIASYILQMDYTYHNSVYGNGSYMINYNAKNFGGNLIKVVAEVGASSVTFTNNSKEVCRGVHNMLKQSQKGTVVLLWLGVNNLDSAATFSYYKSLADLYKSLTFYACSVAGVSEGKTYIKNETIKRFNNNLKAKVESAKISNLKYKSILVNDDPIQVKGSSILHISDSSTDTYGVHFYSSGYKICLEALLSGI